MPRGEGKLDLVGLNGMRSTHALNSPCHCFSFSYGNRNKNFHNFYYRGKVDKKNCTFRIDTGSDVSIVSKSLVSKGRERLPSGGVNLKYPTGEDVPVEFKVKLKVQIGKISKEILMFVADIKDDCLLGVDFLRSVGLGNVFESTFNCSGRRTFRGEERLRDALGSTIFRERFLLI